MPKKITYFTIKYVKKNYLEKYVFTITAVWAGWFLKFIYSLWLKNFAGLTYINIAKQTSSNCKEKGDFDKFSPFLSISEEVWI